MQPEAEGAYTARAVRCHACNAKQHLEETFHDAESGADLAGLMFVADRIEN